MNSDLEMEKCNLAHQMKRLPHPSGEESAESNLSEPPVRQSVVGRVSLAVRAEACNLRVLIGTVRLDVKCPEDGLAAAAARPSTASCPASLSVFIPLESWLVSHFWSLPGEILLHSLLWSQGILLVENQCCPRGRRL